MTDGSTNGTFVEDPAFTALGVTGFGHNITAGDCDNDGDVDLFMVEYTHDDPREQFAPGVTTRTRILLNTGRSTFLENPATELDGEGGDVMACGDYDDGRLDVARRTGSLEYVRNTTSPAGLTRLPLDVVDANGAHTQYGRVVQARPRAAPGVTYMRVVDGGSGFLSVNRYPLLIGTPSSGEFDVIVRFAGGVRTFVVSSGRRVRLFADGRQQIY